MGNQLIHAPQISLNKYAIYTEWEYEEEIFLEPAEIRQSRVLIEAISKDHLLPEKII